MSIDVRVLGELEILFEGEDRTPSGTLPQAIVGVMVAHLGSAMPTDRLIELAWNGAPPASAPSALRVHISRIRKALGVDDVLVSTEHGYRLQVDPAAVDARRFELRVSDGRRLLEGRAYAQAAKQLREALAEWRGRPFGSAAALEGLQSEIRRLEALREEAVVALASAELEDPSTPPDIAAIEALAEANPLDERRWGLLMTALYRRGRQADALAAYRRAEEHLGEELGLVPGPELRALEERILLHDESLARSRTEEPYTLPGFATTFIGRQDDVDRLAEVVAEARCTTITGLGGVGKTRLAVAAAGSVRETFADGAAFVALDPVPTDGAVVDAVAEVLKVESDGQDLAMSIARHLRSRHLLLVLDNCEHVLDGVSSLVETLLADCPRTVVLCTSRVPLGVVGEHVVPVKPLGIPDEDATASLHEYDAVALFAARAHTARPGFELGDHDDAAVVGAIVRALAGLPLAIEIAAAHSDLLTPEEILERIQAEPESMLGLGTDTDARHHTMTRAVQWSLDLLDTPAALLFPRLSVFSSPVDAGAIEAVCAGDGLDRVSTLGALAELTRAALIVVDLEMPRARYGQLPPVRAAGRELLGDETTRYLDRHLHHVVDVVADELRHVATLEEAASFTRLAGLLGEIRQALAHAHAHDRSSGRRLCVDLGTFWVRTGRTAEGRDWVERFLAGAEAESESTMAALWHVAGSLASVEADYGAAEESLLTALDLKRRVGDAREIGMTLSNLGGVANGRGDLAAAERYYKQAGDCFEQAGFRRGMVTILVNLGIVAMTSGRIDDARGLYEQAVEGFRELGDRLEEAHALQRLGYVSAEQGDLESSKHSRLTAHEIFLEAGHASDRAASHFNLAGLYIETGDIATAKGHATAAASIVIDEGLMRWWVPVLLETSALVAEAAEDHDLAARLLGQEATLRSERGLPIMPAFIESHRELEDRIRARLGDSAYEHAYDAGASSTLDDVLRHVIEAWS